MSFQYVPTRLCSPTIPNWTFPPGFWRGIGADDGLVAFNTNNTNLGYYVITRNLWTYRLKIDNAVYSPVFNDVNGFIYWKDNSNFFYYSKAYGWILHNRFPGYEPREDYNPETLMYEGDAFHSGYFLPSAYDNAYVFLQPRGTNRNGGGANKTVYFDFPRWQSVTHRQFGVYEPKGEVSGKKYFGLPRWRDNSSNYYVRSLEKKNGRFSYGGIRYESGKWLLGELNSPSGWWEGEEPNKEKAVTFLFCKPEDSEITGYNRTLSFYDYVQGGETGVAYLGEVAIWR